MGLFNRITATVVSTVDKAVTRVENHDAVVDAMIKDTQHSAASARVRLTRVRKDGDKLRAKLKELEASEKSWTERAKRTAKTDEAKALQCVQRRKACANQIKNIQESLTRHVELERKVSGNLEKIESRMQEVTQQRNMMRSRQSAAEASRVISQIEGSGIGDVEEIFDRWDIMVTETEFAAGSDSSVDSLETDFVEEEDKDILRVELEALLDDEEYKHNE